LRTDIKHVTQRDQDEVTIQCGHPKKGIFLFYHHFRLQHDTA